MATAIARSCVGALLLLAYPALGFESKVVELGDDDATALLQQSVRGHRSGRNDTATASCQCLGWKDAYALHGAKCGQGHEVDFFGVPGPDVPLSLSFEFCSMYFKALPNDNYCMNDRWGQEPGQWCYVSQDCAAGQLSNGGPLRTKACVGGQDPALGEMSFEDFASYIYRSKLELGLATQFAYPTWQPEKFPDVQAFWGLPQPADAQPISEELRARLQQQVASGKPMFFVSRDGHPPYGLVEGQKLYYLNFNPHNPGFARREDMVLFACVAGCGAESRPLW